MTTTHATDLADLIMTEHGSTPTQSIIDVLKAVDSRMAEMEMGESDRYSILYEVHAEIRERLVRGGWNR